jgi:hypothetical protein
LGVPDRFDIVRERLPPDLGEVVAGAMARAGYRPTREAPNAAGPYRRPADAPLCASFEPDPAARPRTVGQVQVRQGDERTLRVEIIFPPGDVQWRSLVWIGGAVCWFISLGLVLPLLHLPHWAETSALMFPTLLGGMWLRSWTGTLPPSQVYRVILDAMAEAVDDANRVRIAAAPAEAARMSEGEDPVEAAGGEGGASHAERRER